MLYSYYEPFSLKNMFQTMNSGKLSSSQQQRHSEFFNYMQIYFVLVLLSIVISCLAHQREVVDFSNYTFNTPKEMISNFINFANTANAFYKDNVKQNINYLTKNMDKLYKKDGTNFYMFIQTDQVRCDYVIGSNGFSQASFSNISLIYPQWSYYFILKMTGPTLEPVYLSNGIIGQGINPSIYKLIETSIKMYEPDSACNCQQVNNISQMIFDLTGYFWQLLCDSKGVTSGSAFAYNGLYGTFKPKSCYYTLFVG